MSDLVQRIRASVDADVNEPLDRLLDEAADRIEALEAALREIHEAHRDSPDGDKVTAEIARRALEGKQK